MALKHKIEIEIAKRIKGGLVRVYGWERKCKDYYFAICFFAMLIIPVGIIAMLK